MKKLAPLIILGLIACAHPAPEGKPGPGGGPRIEWRIDTKVGEQDLPTGRLEVSINGTLHLIDAKVRCGLRKLTSDEYKTHDVPREAIIACAGWWAGSGDEFYAQLEKGGLAVYHREIGEGIHEKPAYKKVKVIALATP